MLGLEHHEQPYRARFDTERLSSRRDEEWPGELHAQFWLANGHEDIVYEVARWLCGRNDVVISHYLSHPTKAATAKSSVPHVAVQLTHELTPTKHRPPLGSLPNLGVRLNPVMWEILAEFHDRHGPDTLPAFWSRRGLPPLKHMTDVHFSDLLNILAVSPTLCTPQPDWEGLHVVSGFLDLPPSDEETCLEPEVRDFLTGSDKPVFMALGSTQEIYPGSNIQQNMDLMMQAALVSDAPALIQVPDGLRERYPPHTRAEQSPNVLFVGRLPYGEVLKSCAAVVHHGGAGTCHLAVRANCPSIVVSFTPHHFFFGLELHRVGVAPPPARRSDLTPEMLGQSIRDVLVSDAYRERTAELGAEMRLEDGVACAVRTIEERMSSVSV